MSYIESRQNDESINLTVSSKTNTIMLGDSIYGNIIRGDRIHLTSAGAYATSQAVKSLAYARNRLASQGIDIAWYSQFETVVGKKDGREIVLVHTEIIFIDEEGKVHVRRPNRSSQHVQGS